MTVSTALTRYTVTFFCHVFYLVCLVSITRLVLYAVDYFFFFNDTATTEIYTLSLHDALPISLTATDQDSHASGFADPFTFALVSGTGDTDNAAFTIVGDALKINASADFEVKSSYDIRVQVRSEEHTSELQSLRHIVCHLLLAPTAINLSASSIDENNAAGATVATLTATFFF